MLNKEYIAALLASIGKPNPAGAYGDVSCHSQAAHLIILSLCIFFLLIRLRQRLECDPEVSVGTLLCMPHQIQPTCRPSRSDALYLLASL